MIWFTSDLHFGHDKSFIYQARGFHSVWEMNNALVWRWNELVAPEDTVYILGDALMGNVEDSLVYFLRLNGNIHILQGNHDGEKALDAMELGGATYHGYADKLAYGQYNFYLSHYPTITSTTEIIRPLKRKLINLHGHTHAKEKFYLGNPYAYNVGVDAHNCRPVSIEQILTDIMEAT